MFFPAYKLRKHIAKALQARSRAIKTALVKYNEAAAALHVPREPLSWEQVVEYAFLSDFDLLRDGRDDIRQYAWATPAGRLAMDQYYKLERADEEINRLNIEIRRLLTHIRDEEAFLRREEARVRRESGDALAHQVFRYRMERGRFDGDHVTRLTALAKMPGFTGSLAYGVPVNKERLQDLEAGQEGTGTGFAAAVLPLPSDGDDGEDDAQDEEDDLEAQFTVLSITEDGAD
jgi:hypothetical protein